ncbi:MAG: hypothetical protein KC912_10105 [Proteobacteria bacterium]|nr:hypothetical protein [Pseudomonadota bacterium]
MKVDQIGAWLRAQPVVPSVALLLAWVVFGVANVAVHLLSDRMGFHYETAVYLGLSVWRPEPHALGLLIGPLVVALLITALHHAPRTPATATALGGALLVAGNLIQGVPAFLKPITGPRQYGEDSPAWTEALEWLAKFNEQQPTLGLHARTHPPFATLAHTVFEAPFDVGPWGVVVAFTLAGVALVPLCYALARAVGATRSAAWHTALLAAAVPAANVYAVVSVDAVVAMLSTVAVLGLAYARRDRLVLGVILFALGALGANLLSFGGTFLLALAAGLALWDAASRRHFGALACIATGVTLVAITIATLRAGFGYDHLLAFQTASALENPDGIYFVADPLNYVATRLEGVIELLLWLGMASAWLFRPIRGRWTAESTVAIATIALMLISGAYRTSETARAMLFMVPILLLPLRHLDDDAFAGTILLCAMQAMIFQTIGDSLW